MDDFKRIERKESEAVNTVYTAGVFGIINWPETGLGSGSDPFLSQFFHDFDYSIISDIP